MCKVEKVFGILKPERTRILAITRANIVDWVVCQVKDCFAGDAGGVLVDANGKQIDVSADLGGSCINRRSMNLTDDVLKVRLEPDLVKAFMKLAEFEDSGSIATLPPRLQNYAHSWWKLEPYSIEKRGFAYSTVSLEDLSAFEYSDMTQRPLSYV